MRSLASCSTLRTMDNRNVDGPWETNLEARSLSLPSKRKMATPAISPMWKCSIQDCTKPAVRTVGDCTLCDHRLCARHLQPQYHSCSRWEVRSFDAQSLRGTKIGLRTAIFTTRCHKRPMKKNLPLFSAKLNLELLKARATKIRQGMPCHIDPPRFEESTRWSVMGGMNHHVEIRFEDGVKWLARIRRFNATSPPSELRDHILRSEVATMKFLEQTSVPAPKVHDFALETADTLQGTNLSTTKGWL